MLVKNETAARVEFQRGRVVEAVPSEDGHLRSVQVEYKNPGEKVYRHTLCPIQKIVVIVPAGLKTTRPVDLKLETEAVKREAAVCVYL